MDLLSIDVIIVTISEYLDTECKNFLEIMNVAEKYEYLYAVYNENNAMLYPTKVRYLKIYHNVHDLHKCKNLIDVTFGNDFNRTLINGMFPDSVQSINFVPNFKRPLRQFDLPSSLTYLKFGSCFDQPFEKNILPDNLLYLHFGFAFNQPIENDVLPNNIIQLIFGEKFNQCLEISVLPKSLKKICVYETYKYIDHLTAVAHEREIKLTVRSWTKNRMFTKY